MSTPELFGVAPLVGSGPVSRWGADMLYIHGAEPKVVGTSRKRIALQIEPGAVLSMEITGGSRDATCRAEHGM